MKIKNDCVYRRYFPVFSFISLQWRERTMRRTDIRVVGQTCWLQKKNQKKLNVFQNINLAFSVRQLFAEVSRPHTSSKKTTKTRTSTWTMIWTYSPLELNESRQQQNKVNTMSAHTGHSSWTFQSSYIMLLWSKCQQVSFPLFKPVSTVKKNNRGVESFLCSSVSVQICTVLFMSDKRDWLMEMITSKRLVRTKQFVSSGTQHGTKFDRINIFNHRSKYIRAHSVFVIAVNHLW